jgi:hypothetical protein
MRFFLFINLVFLSACTSQYKSLQRINGDITCIQKFRPVFVSALYNTQVNVVGKHLSGLLLIKTMPDSSIRMVFSNEMGFKFFDFGFSADGVFNVYAIIKQMNKKNVIKTLENDFQLVLMNHLETAKGSLKTDGKLLYYSFPNGKGFNYYITNAGCTELVKIEGASKKKTKVEVIMNNYIAGVPDTIGISHKNFHFTIGLKRLERNVER